MPATEATGVHDPSKRPAPSIELVVGKLPREVGRERDSAVLDPVRMDVERARRRRAEKPLLRGHRVEVAPELPDIDGDRPGRLGAVDEERDPSPGELGDRQHDACEPRHVRDRDEPGLRRDLRLEGRQEVRGGQVPDGRDAERRARGDEAAEEARVLGVGRDDLVARARSRSPPIAMLHPSVVDVVSATHPFPAPMSPANASRSRSRSARAARSTGGWSAPPRARAAGRPPSPPPSRAGAARTSLRSDRRSDRARAGRRGPLRGRCDHRLDRGVVREHERRSSAAAPRARSPAPARARSRARAPGRRRRSAR